MIQNIMDCISWPSASVVLRYESFGLQTGISGKRDVWLHPDSYLIVKPPGLHIRVRFCGAATSLDRSVRHLPARSRLRARF